LARLKERLKEYVLPFNKNSMNQFIWILIVALAGAMLPIQAGLNNKMGKAIESPIWASLISFAVGVLALLAYSLISKTGLQVGSLKTVSGYTWLAGVFGAFYVTVVAVAFPKLGPALTFGIVVAGQLLISLLLDHFNVLVSQQHSINVYRILGMLLIIAGVFLIRKF
jgi:bacterial/archaeal transporter family-2 protein